MSLSIRIEDIAKTIVDIDTTDLPALVQLQDELTDIGSSIDDPSQESIISICNHAAEAVESIVLRSAEDPDKAYHQVCESIDYIQSVLDVLSAGGDPSSIQKPDFIESGIEKDKDQEFDKELLEAWIDSCGSALNDLESTVVELESGINDAGQSAEARRVIHTIKGEAGILSYNTIQKVCHECESLIDICERDGKDFPATEVLEVIDWIRSCIAALVVDAKSAFPDCEGLLGKLTAESQMSGSPAEESTDAQVEELGCDEKKSEIANASKQAEQNETTATESENCVSTEPESGNDEFVKFPENAIIDDTTADFVCEAQEHIANAESSLMDLEHDFTNTELINTVFRAFHTIKGVAGFMNLTPIVRLTHIAETLLDKARSGKLDLSTEYLDLFLKSCDVLGQLIDSLQEGNGPRQHDYAEIVNRLEVACNGELSSDTACDADPDKQSPPKKSEIQTPANSTSARDEGDHVPANPEKNSDANRAQASDSGNAKSTVPSMGTNIKESKKVITKKTAMKFDQTVKVNTQRMDALIDMVGELVIGYQMVSQDNAIQSIEIQKTKRTIGHVSNIIRDLQEVAMSLRLVTLRSTFQKMARLVRDLSSKSGKNIRFIVEGEDVELDRGVVEHIADPLVHMIRNACDHGIETVEERSAAGKPAEGNLWLRAYHQGGSIVIEIKEDGRGLNREKLLQKAISLNLVSQDRNLAEIPDNEVFNYIFMPGFSTAEKLTDVSGRGVGMDVVRRNIESLRGKIDIQSELGKGSTFKIQLPLTMAIIDGMVVRVGNQRYVIPTLTIEQSFRANENDIHTVAGKGEMVEVRGAMLPIYRAKLLFGLQSGEDSIEKGLMVVVESRDMKYCLFVDEIVGQQQVVIKSLGHGVASVPGVSGGAILGDGKVALILDVGGLTSLKPMPVAESV